MNKLIVAHRGASMLKPENTLAAFKTALEIGAQMIELDVRKTADNILVVIHDPSYRGYKVAKLNYEYLVSLSKNQVPTLQHVLKLVAGKIKLNIELKEAGYEREALKLIRKYVQPKDFLVTSFIRSAVLEAKKADPEIVAGWILGENAHKKIWNYWLAKRKIDFLSIHKSQVRHFSKLGLPLFVWTVDDERELRYLLQRDQVFALISNRPNVALRIKWEMYGE
jgi:glycerophosphoryl diester phosphodiesterase